MKTPKAIAKRFRVTKKGKVRARKGGQDHFNAGETGNKMRGKRRDISMTDHHARNIKKLLSK